MKKNYLLFLIIFVVPMLGNATNFYIDSQSGNDANSGTSPSQAWASLTKLNHTVFTAGDSILFRANGIWTGSFSPQGSGTAGAPIVISRYGTGNKPLLRGAGVACVICFSNQSYWQVHNLEITNTATGEASRLGIRITANNGITNRHFHMKNLSIHDVFGRYTFEIIGKNTGGIGVRITGGGDDTRFDDILIEGCEIYDIVRVGISSHNSQSNANSRQGNQPITNFVIRNNYIARCAGDGIILRSTFKAIVENNIGFENHNANENLVSYGVAFWCRSADSTIFQFNEVYGTKGVLDGQSFDADFESHGAIFQYNYSHDNEGGFMLTMNGVTGTVLRYNISQNDGYRSGHLVHFSDWNPGTYPTRGWMNFYNNTIYIPSGNVTVVDKAMANSSFSNNIICNHGTGNIQLSSQGQTAVWRNNLIFGRNSYPNDPNLITTNPMLINPGSGATGMNTVDGYKLDAASPALRSGMIIQNNGGRDYYGNQLPSGNPNRGAYGGQGVLSTGLFDKTLATETYEVYPNPCTEALLKFKIKEEVVAQSLFLQVFDLTGNKVLEEGMQRDVAEMAVNILVLRPGVYVARLKGDGEVIGDKLVVVK
ncbi:MAG: T9SS type A sorting domain-containing protein [Cytophagaceae bacterium]